MPSPSPEALRLGTVYRLGLGTVPRRGAAGQHLGKATGSSLEFQDRRAYAPGDDVRHLDWRALARTDQLLVRQYHEELLPRVELLLDDSRSMASEPQKAQVLVDLAAVLAQAAANAGYLVALVALGDEPRPLAPEGLAGEGLACAATRSPDTTLAQAGALLRPGGLRLLVSDFLFPHRASELLSSLGRGAGALAFVQVLGSADRDPPVDVAQRLVDAESGEFLDLVVEPELRARYLARLERLVDGLHGECRRRGALHVDLDAGSGLDALCRERLTAAGVLVPA